jgi:hypothetical protein
MEICYQKKKTVVYSEACPEVKLRALAADAETKLLSDCCRLAIRYAEETPLSMPEWFSKRYMKFCKEQTKEKGAAFQNRTEDEKLLLFAEYEKGEHPFINFCARGYDESEVKDKKTGKMKKGPWRKQKFVRLSGIVAIDIDGVKDPKAIFEGWQQNLDFKALKIYLIYITPRGNGLRVVFRCDVSRGNLIDNQMWMCEKLGVEPDESCKDASRGYFLTSEENFLFDNLKEMYEDEPDEAFINQYEPVYRAGNSKGVRSQETGASRDVLAQGNLQTPDSPAPDSSTIKWHGYDVQKIIDARYAAKLPCADDHNRHKESLKLATDLLLMLDGDAKLVLRIVAAQEWVKEIVKERDENVAQTVESAAECVAQKEKKYGANVKPSKAMQEAVEKVCGQAYEVIISPPESGGVRGGLNARTSAVDQTTPSCGHPSYSGGEIETLLLEWGLEIEKLFDVYPCLREICRGLKPASYPAALFTSAAFLGTDMTRCWWFHYYEPGKERRLNYCVYIIGDPGSGKSFAGRLYKLLAAPIISSDKMSNDAINRYKKKLKARQSSTKEQKKEPLNQPEVIVRCHGARTANGVFIEDMNSALDVVGDKEIHLHMLTFDAELDSSTAAAKGGQWIDKSTMELKAFHNEEDSQQYKNVDSVTGPFDVFWNYVFTGTPMALHKKVTMNNFGSGLSTRLACIPFMPNRKMVDCCKYTRTDYEGDEMLKTWAYRLDKVSGELPVWPIVETTWEWTRDHFLISELNEDNADFMLSLRVSYYGVNVAAPFILMRHWEQWQKDHTLPIDDTDRKLSELIMDIQYGCQHYFFGEYARTYYNNKERDEAANVGNKHSKTRMAYNRLPESFTVDDVMKAFGTDYDYSRVVISRFVKEGTAERISKGKYKKVISVL